MNTTYILIGLAVLAITLFIVAMTSSTKETTVVVEEKHHHPYHPEPRPWWHWW